MSQGSGKYGTAWKKTRHDNYYHLAKEQGYRSRACFKLIQVNKSFDFLSKCKCVIDLCAAPGGWLQVLTKTMPSKSLIVGVDLFPIKYLPGVVTLQNDITTEACRVALKKALQGWQCDAIVHDGAPNTGGATWAKDAFIQNELVIHSLRICTLFLKAGGTFVTKVFRSQDYNAILWVLRQFFANTTVTKPSSSRAQSAEIFVVCEGYLAPRKIDPKLLDPVEIFKQDTGEQKTVDVFHDKGKRNRSGYDDDMPMTMTKKAKVSEFLEAELPAVFLGEYTSMIFDRAAEIYLNYKETNAEIKELLKDLKVLGKSDFSALLKWRKKMIQYQKDLIAEQPLEEGEEEEPEVELTAEEQAELEEKKITANLLELKEKMQQKKRNEKRKKKEKMQKEKKKRELNINNLTSESGDQGELGLFAMKSLKDEGALDAVHNTGDGDALPETIHDSDASLDESDFSDDSDSGSDEDARYSRMEKDLNAAYEDYKDRRKIVAKAKKVKPMEAEEAVVDEAEVADDEEEEDSEDNDNPLMVRMEKAPKPSKNSVLNRWFERDLFQNNFTSERGDESESDHDNDFDTKKPRKKDRQDRMNKKREADKKKVTDTQNGGSEDQKHAGGDQNKKRKRDSDDDEDKDSSDSEDTKKKANSFEEVPMSDYSSDTDAQADMMAMGQLMIRKKNKSNLLNNAYNRYSYNDTAELPEWFVSEENQHNKAPLPVTKEMVNNFKMEMKAIDARPIKKVAEAKARKKIKALAQIEKMKKRAHNVLDSTDTTFHNKMKVMHKLANKKMAKTTTQKDKSYVVSSKGGQHKGKGGSKGKDVKFVDRRMRSDQRGEKRAKKRGAKFDKNMKARGKSPGGSQKKGKK